MGLVYGFLYMYTHTHTYKKTQNIMSLWNAHSLKSSLNLLQYYSYIFYYWEQLQNVLVDFCPISVNCKSEA